MDNTTHPNLKSAIKTLKNEAAALHNLAQKLDDSFSQVIEALLKTRGRIIVTGVGKSALVAQKMVATLNSTGSPAMYIHASDAIHGDLGAIQAEDALIIISKSGETIEIQNLIASLNQNFFPLISIVNKPKSFLASHSNFVLFTHIEEEACPHNLAPTTSTTTQMALGDAIAIALLEKKGFASADFAKLHPGGKLGERLFKKLEDLALKNEKPYVLNSASFQELILEISGKRLGAAAILDSEMDLIGIATDGDLRRAMQKNKDIEHLELKSVFSKNPICVEKETTVYEALQLMQSKKITQLIVLDSNKYFGMVHIHDLL